MNTSIFRLLAAVLALTFLVAACASDTGAQWTFAPVAIADTGGPETVTEEAVTDVVAGEADADELPAGEGNAETATEAPAEATATEPPGDVAGEPRVIEFQADGTLRFVDGEGNQVQDIPVAPGETVLFRIDNTAGFDHNFYIGQDAELSAPAAVTADGIADWATGVEELEWTVPDDISGLKFGCTVPGHYTLMQGTFSLADGPIEPVEPVDPVESMAPAETAGPEAAETVAPDPGTGGATDARVIRLEATGALQFTQDGERILDIPVTPGEVVIFEVDNTAGFDHNFYIGTDEQLSPPAATTDIGIPDWTTGVESVEWQVPDDITGLKFGCTVPGHYTLMQGTFSVSP